MPALPTMNRPGSSTSWQPAFLTAGQDHLGEGARPAGPPACGNGCRSRRPCSGTRSCAPAARSCSMSDQPLSTPCRYGSAVRIGEPRCMCRPTTWTLGWPTTPSGDFQDRVDVEAELDALDAGVGLGVRLGRQVRVDAQGDLAPSCPSPCATSPMASSSASLSTLNRKTPFSRRVADLGIGLADAGEDDLRRRSPPALRARYSSPPLVTSKPAPCSAISRQMLRLALVLTL